MGTQTVSTSVLDSMPVTMAGMIEEKPSFTPTEPTKNVNRLRDLKTSARDQLMIDPRIILVDEGHNPRDYTLAENHAHLDELKRSIRENGTLVPLLVRYDPERKAAVLVDGECRLRANLELISEGVEIATVPTIQVPGGNESERLLTAITANTGKPLSKWELGTAFQRLYRFGWDEEKIATKTGYTRSFITQAMELADAPEEIKQMLSSQAVTPSLALAELRANGAAAVNTLRAAAKSAQSNGQKTAKRVKSPSANLQTKPATSDVLPANVVKAILALIEDVPAEDLNDTAPGAVAVVKVSKLLKVLSFAITEDDLKGAGVETANF